MVERFGRWLRANTPNREELARSRWLKPFGQRVLHAEFWRFTRRSVPRGVAIGLLVGIFLLIPGLQIVGSALLCIPLRGNIPIAAAMTFLSNPATTPLILLASMEVGSVFGFRTNINAFYELVNSGAGVSEWLAWAFSDAAPAMLIGLSVLAVGAAVLGYVLSDMFWRWWTARKWRRRASRWVSPRRLGEG